MAGRVGGDLRVMATERRQAVRLIAMPFHDGLEGVDRGLGPVRLLDALEAGDVLAQLGCPVSVETVTPVDRAEPEAARVFQLARRLAAHVVAAHADRAFPLVVAGDCNSCLGTVAGCGSDDLGVVWFDAHADSDTPDDSRSGSLDAMGLALLTGRGWRRLQETIPGLLPVTEDRIVLAGARDLDPEQRDRLARSRIWVLAGDAFSQRDLRAALDDLRARAKRVYLHIDLDALDPSEGIANRYSAPGGLTTTDLEGAIADVFERFQVEAAAVTAYEPAADRDGRMARTATRLLAAVAKRACEG